jgi:hypothetical protein
MTDENGASPVTLAAYVQAVGADDLAFVQQCAAEATELVTGLIGGSADDPNPFAVPQAIVARAVLEVGADLYFRRASRNGIVPFDGDDPQPMRINRDPLVAAYPILRPYLVMGL